MIAVRVFVLFAVFLIPLCDALAGGTEVHLLLKNGREVRGELLVAKEKVFLLSEHSGLSDSRLRLDSIFAVGIDDIQEVKTVGKSYLGDGMAYGLIAGTCIGVLMAFDPSGQGRSIPFGGGEDPVDGPGGKAIAIGAAGGLAVGGLLGAVQSTHDRTRSMDGVRTLIIFEDDARYKSEIPEFLQLRLKALNPESKTRPPD